jgi:hypothetical protein
MIVPDGAGAVYRTENGFAPMPVPVGLAALDAALRGTSARRLFLYGDPERALPLCHGDCGAPASEPPSEPPSPPGGKPDVPWASQYITSLFSELLDMPEHDIDPARGLDSYGIDSILVRNFNTRVERDLGAIPHTLLFECRTLAQVAAVLASRFPDITAAPRPVEQVAPRPVEQAAPRPVEEAAPAAGCPAGTRRRRTWMRSGATWSPDATA